MTDNAGLKLIDENGPDPYMKLLFVHQHFGAWGGAETNIQTTARELKRRGHALSLLYAEPTGRNEEAWHDLFPQTFVLPAKERVAAVARVLEKLRPDLIYLHSIADLNVLEALLASATPVIRMVHDHALYCLRGYKYHPLTRKVCERPASFHCVFPCLASVARNRGAGLPLKFVSYRERLRELELSRRCKRLVVYSDYSRAELVRNGFDPARIQIHVPLPTRPEGPVSSFSERNLVLFAGQIIRGKGVDLLLRALAKVRVPFECEILGDGNHRRYCEKLCSSLGLSGRVRFRGFVPPDQMERSYLEASAFAMSSVWPEPFGLVGPEAMRYGLPVVAFDAGGIREWLLDGENGFLVPWMDTDSFAARLQELLLDKTLGRQMGWRGRERVHREYAAPVQVARLESLFNNVLAESADTSLSVAPHPAELPSPFATLTGNASGQTKALAYE